MSQFSILSATTPVVTNTVGRWLAQNDFTGNITVQSDYVILVGNAVIPTINAACRIAKEQQAPLLVSGGIDYSMHFLYDAIAQHSCYSIIRITGCTEAAVLVDITHQFWQVLGEKIRVEDQSTNYGEDARFSYVLLNQAAESIHTVIVTQDPTIQCCTMTTSQRVTRSEPCVPRWLSFLGFAPESAQQHNSVDFVPVVEGLWPVERYLSLITGKLPCLHDDATGYGSCGYDFTVHVDIPQDVEQAWLQLKNGTTLTDLLESRLL